MILTCYARVEKVMLKHTLFEESNDDLADSFFQMTEKRIVLCRGCAVDEIQEPAELRRNIICRAFGVQDHRHRAVLQQQAVHLRAGVPKGVAVQSLPELIEYTDEDEETVRKIRIILSLLQDAGINGGMVIPGAPGEDGNLRTLDLPDLHLHTADRVIRQVRVNIQTDTPAVVAGVDGFFRLRIPDAPDGDAEDALKDFPADVRISHQRAEEIIVLDGDVLQSF